MLVERVSEATVSHLPLSRARLRNVAALGSLVFMGCASGEPPPEQKQTALVYGDDDRQEVGDVDDVLASAVSRSVVAIIPRGHLDATGNLRSDVPTSMDFSGLCPGEPYGAQPAAALCTGVLVDWDLVLTAGHCVRALALEDLMVAFDYYYERSDADLSVLPLELYAPVEIVSERLGRDGDVPRLDYALVRLERDVTGEREPVALRVQTASVGETLTTASTGGGVPLKIDLGGHVVDARSESADYFVADTDTSQGSSGGPAFDEEMLLLGVLVRGGADLAGTDAGCNTTSRLRTEDADENFTYAGIALREICADEVETSLCREECADPCRALPRSSGSASAQCAWAPSASHPRTWNLASWLALGLAMWWRRSRKRRRVSTHGAHDLPPHLSVHVSESFDG
jgi:hypothetical protein